MRAGRAADRRRERRDPDQEARPHRRGQPRPRRGADAVPGQRQPQPVDRDRALGLRGAGEDQGRDAEPRHPRRDDARHGRLRGHRAPAPPARGRARAGDGADRLLGRGPARARRRRAGSHAEAVREERLRPQGPAAPAGHAVLTPGAAPGGRLSKARLFAYFFRVGATAYGGAAPQLAMMERDWVRENAWATRVDFERGLALSTLCPGPVGSQLAAYLGRLHAGASGAAAAMLGFLLPSFALVVAIAALYGRWGGRAGPRAFAAGCACAVIAVVLRSSAKLTKTMLGTDRSSWAVAAAAAAVTLAAPSASTLAIVGAAALCAFADSRPTERGAVPADAAALVGLTMMGVKAGLLTFGTGLAILPTIRAHAVGHGWVTDPQFVDAVSAGMVTPGPIVMAAAFVGFLRAGLGGATAAVVGLFAPIWATTMLAAPLIDRWSHDARVRGFARGAMAGAMGSIFAAAVAMAAATLTAPARVALAAGAGAALLWTPLPEPLVILIAGAAGRAVL
ncbi:MAG: chromate transporter [Elusimicrobia bacterium]|nr:chromate transporter [Elusimicrobiota bacterium]